MLEKVQLSAVDIILSNTADIVAPVAGPSGGSGGTLKRVGQEILVPQPFGNYGGVGSYYLNQVGTASHILNGATEYAAVLCRVPEILHGKTVVDVYIGLQSVDATGDLTVTMGTNIASGGGTGITTKSTTVTLSATTAVPHTVKATFASGLTVNRGENFWVHILSTSAQVKVLHGNNRNTNDLIKCRSEVNTGAGAVFGTLPPMVVAVADDGTVGIIEGMSFVLDGDGTNSLGDGYGHANRLTAPFDATVVGIWQAEYSLVSGSFNGNMVWGLYDSDESELNSVVVPSRIPDYPANKPGIMTQYFSTPTNIQEGQSVFAGVMVDDATSGVELRPYIWKMSHDATHAAIVSKSVPGFALWDVTPYIWSGGVLEASSDKTYMHPVGLILSHIK